MCITSCVCEKRQEGEVSDVDSFKLDCSNTCGPLLLENIYQCVCTPAIEEHLSMRVDPCYWRTSMVQNKFDGLILTL